jgi:hypothetical protein
VLLAVDVGLVVHDAHQVPVEESYIFESGPRPSGLIKRGGKRKHFLREATLIYVGECFVEANIDNRPKSLSDESIKIYQRKGSSASHKNCWQNRPYLIFAIGDDSLSDLVLHLCRLLSLT